MKWCESRVEVSIVDYVVKLRFCGVCPSCPFLYSELFPFVRDLILEKVEGVEKVELEEI